MDGRHRVLQDQEPAVDVRDGRRGVRLQEVLHHQDPEREEGDGVKVGRNVHPASSGRTVGDAVEGSRDVTAPTSSASDDVNDAEASFGPYGRRDGRKSADNGDVDCADIDEETNFDGY